MVVSSRTHSSDFSSTTPATAAAPGTKPQSPRVGSSPILILSKRNLMLDLLLGEPQEGSPLDRLVDRIVRRQSQDLLNDELLDEAKHLCVGQAAVLVELQF